jgi:O-antigen ligase
MKNSFSISTENPEKSWCFNLFYYSCLALVAGIPFYSRIINIAIVSMIAAWLLLRSYRYLITGIASCTPLLLMVIFFLINSVSLAYSTDVVEGLNVLGKKIMLFVFPLLFASVKFSLTEKQRDNILKVFFASSSAAAALCLSVGLDKYYKDGDINHLLYENLTAVIGLQPIYFAVYICFSCVLIFRWLNQKLSKTYEYILFGLLGMFVVVSLLLSARTATLCLGLVLIVSGFNLARSRNQVKYFVIGLSFFIGIGLMLILKVDFLTERFQSLICTKFYFSPEENNANGLTLRLVKWQCAIEGIQKNMLLGVGLGDVQEYLQGCYRSKDFWGQVMRFNSHNQFLQTALAVGLVGLLVFLSALAIFAKKLSKNSVLDGLWFLVIILICSMTESILERKQGIIFFGFFFSFYGHFVRFKK